jgi:integrase
MVPRRDFIKALKRACRRAGIPEVSPHSLRHTWATRFAMAGCDRRTLMELGGWKCGEVLDTIYAHTTDAHKDAVVQRLGIEASAGPTRIPRISGQPVIEAMQ